MNIAILGLGYVGTVAAACLARSGHHVVGIDVNPQKVALFNAGRSPVVEPKVGDMLADAAAEGRVRGAQVLDAAAEALDMAMVCVGTPSRADGHLDLSQLLECTRQLGQAVRQRRSDRQLLLVFRSTIPPGSMERLILPTLEHAIGKGPGQQWEVAYNPEFLRESTSVADYFSPPKIVIGERRRGLTRQLLGLYAGINAPLFEVSFATAEFSKFMDNSWHALKVAFANEVGRIAAARGVDPQEAASLFLADTKLNISTYYLSPGGPYGGSCLPKDLSGTVALARASGIEVPVLSSIKDSNRAHLAWLLGAVQSRLAPPEAILLLGLSFKAGTDDLRNSPLLDLAELLIQHGYALEIYDPDIDPNHLIGVNFAVAIEHRATLFERLIQDVDAATERCRLIIRGKPMPAVEARLPANVPFLDVHRLKGFEAQGSEVD